MSELYEAMQGRACDEPWVGEKEMELWDQALVRYEAMREEQGDDV